MLMVGAVVSRIVACLCSAALEVTRPLRKMAMQGHACPYNDGMRILDSVASFPSRSYSTCEWDPFRR